MSTYYILKSLEYSYVRVFAAPIQYSSTQHHGRYTMLYNMAEFNTCIRVMRVCIILYACSMLQCVCVAKIIRTFCAVKYPRFSKRATKIHRTPEKKNPCPGAAHIIIILSDINMFIFLSHPLAQ